jgi:hypothetical protein
MALCMAISACGGADDGSPEESGADDAGSSGARAGAGGSREDDAGTGEPVEDADAATSHPGGADGGTHDADGGGTDPDAGPQTDPPVALPEGSREVNEVVNLVSAEAAQELEEFLQDDRPPVHAVLRQGLATSVNLFLQYYEEVHDFLFVFTDHSLTGTGTVGSFESINRPAAPGGGNEIEIALGGYRTTGRLRAVIGVQWRTPVGPPLSHEILHEWAVHLDRSLGFGLGRDVDYGPHWGFVGVHGQLGGFDATTLRCETPAGAMPPGCTAGGNGRTRYVVGQFFPNSNPSVPYAPLELYLMGLLPASEVPEAISVLDQAEEIEGSFDQTARTIVVEAGGMHEIAFADIVARHGEIEPLAEADRHFSAAFIVVSSEPAPDEVMDDVAEWAAAFGNRGTSGVVTAFETLTGDRATLDTTLGPRRTQAAPAPELRERFECDVLGQDCPRPELACYGFGPSFCALSGGVTEGQACDQLFACAAGLDCYSGPSDPDTYLCTPYCDPDDDASPLACSALCPGMEQSFLDADQQTLGAICLN